MPIRPPACGVAAEYGGLPLSCGSDEPLPRISELDSGAGCATTASVSSRPASGGSGASFLPTAGAIRENWGPESGGASCRLATQGNVAGLRRTRHCCFFTGWYRRLSCPGGKTWRAAVSGWACGGPPGLRGDGEGGGRRPGWKVLRREWVTVSAHARSTTVLHGRVEVSPVLHHVVERSAGRSVGCAALPAGSPRMKCQVYDRPPDHAMFMYFVPSLSSASI